MTMNTVKKLMIDMEMKAISREEFSALIPLIFDIDTNTLKDDWLKVIEQYSSGRTFLAKQCMDLLAFIAPLAPFEKFDCACLLYTRILSKDSFQLVVNSFDDEIERGNLLHRLGLDRGEGGGNQGDGKGPNSHLVTNCKILPSAPIATANMRDSIP